MNATLLLALSIGLGTLAGAANAQFAPFAVANAAGKSVSSTTVGDINNHSACSDKFGCVADVGISGANVGATASADPYFGTLRAIAENGSIQSNASAFAQFGDVVTFTAGANASPFNAVTLNYSFHGGFFSAGTTQAPVKPQGSSATLSIYVNGVTQFFGVTDTSCAPFSSYTSCVVGQGISTTGSVTVPVTGLQATLIVHLQVDAAPGETADFGNTARFFLNVPDGVTYTSASGYFLNGASPVPEPGSALLMLVGGIAVVAGRTRARSSNMTAKA